MSLPEGDVLVVEDDADMAEVVALTLEFGGYRVRIAHNGKEALEKVAQSMPRAIILDMLMPVMNGWEFAAEFQRLHRAGAPILVLTAAEQSEARAQEIGAQDSMAKPFDVDELLLKVQRMCRLAGQPS